MRTVWYLFAATVFGVSAIVYASTFFKVDLVDQFPKLLLMHLLVIAAAAPGVVYLRRQSRNKDDYGWLMRNAPWSGRVATALGLNGMLCFGLLFVSGGGKIEKRGDKFVTVSKGGALGELTEAQYDRLRGFEVRFFSSYWMLFSAYPALVFAAAHKASRRGGDPLDGTGDWNAPPRITELDGGKVALIERVGNESQEPLFKLFDNPGQSFSKSFTLDELPADLHSLLGSADKIDLQFHHAGQIKILGPDGQWHTFHSAEEMPSDLRQLYETNQQPNEWTTRKVFLKLADSQGGERTYHSLDEMPPEIRALFERLRSFRGDV